MALLIFTVESPLKMEKQISVLDYEWNSQI